MYNNTGSYAQGTRLAEPGANWRWTSAHIPVFVATASLRVKASAGMAQSAGLSDCLFAFTIKCAALTGAGLRLTVVNRLPDESPEAYVERDDGEDGDEDERDGHGGPLCCIEPLEARVGRLLAGCLTAAW